MPVQKRPGRSSLPKLAETSPLLQSGCNLQDLPFNTPDIPGGISQQENDGSLPWRWVLGRCADNRTALIHTM